MKYEIYVKSKAILSLIICGTVLYKECSLNILDCSQGPNFVTIEVEKAIEDRGVDQMHSHVILFIVLHKSA